MQYFKNTNLPYLFIYYYYYFVLTLMVFQSHLTCYIRKPLFYLYIQCMLKGDRQWNTIKATWKSSVWAVCFIPSVLKSHTKTVECSLQFIWSVNSVQRILNIHFNILSHAHLSISIHTYIHVHSLKACQKWMILVKMTQS